MPFYEKLYTGGGGGGREITPMTFVIGEVLPSPLGNRLCRYSMLDSQLLPREILTFAPLCTHSFDCLPACPLGVAWGSELPSRKEF